MQHIHTSEVSVNTLSLLFVLVVHLGLNEVGSLVNTNTEAITRQLVLGEEKRDGELERAELVLLAVLLACDILIGSLTIL